MIFSYSDKKWDFTLIRETEFGEKFYKNLKAEKSFDLAMESDNLQVFTSLSDFPIILSQSISERKSFNAGNIAVGDDCNLYLNPFSANINDSLKVGEIKGTLGTNISEFEFFATKITVISI